MEVKLSIIMPSLNVAEYIEECIDSALNQTLKQIEILCIDAGSTDGTCEILQKYENMHVLGKTIKLIHSDIKSYGYQVNLGIKLAIGKYIAILETDDYVEKQMYEQLVNIAEANDVDVVKADYDRFSILKSGERLFEKIALWSGDFNKYNIVINPRYDDYIYANDINIWKGIYKRDFLIKNNIWLYETSGAAFQDIGFAQQVIACAERVYYSDMSFYRYRIDRDDSSTNSLKGLLYSRQEFMRLISESDIYEKLVCKQGIYRRMAQSFRDECCKLFMLFDYDTIFKNLKNDYDWFCEILNKAVMRSDFDLSKLPDNTKEDLEFLISDCRGYAEKWHLKAKQQKEKEDGLVNKIRKGNVIVFGAGKIGDTVVKILLKSGIEPVVIFDNNKLLWGRTLYNIPIVEPVKPEENAYVVIANKVNAIKIERQLMDMGARKEQIIFSDIL